MLEFSTGLVCSRCCVLNSVHYFLWEQLLLGLPLPAFEEALKNAIVSLRMFYHLIGRATPKGLLAESNTIYRCEWVVVAVWK